MSTQAPVCDARRITDFLEHRLNDSQQALLEEHLSQCAVCRASLESQTAVADFWEKTSRYLREDDCEVFPSSRDEALTVHDRSTSISTVLEALGPTDDPAMLGRLGGYEISGVVGAGGMGVVLKAYDRSLDRTVAIKVLAPQLASSGAARKRFAREAKAAAAVLHPNVIAIHSVSNDGTLPYLVMPYVRGASLQRRLDAEGPLPLPDILRIGAQIAAGLAAAHQTGLVHRDVKPANILLEEGVERVAITDFGLARAVDDASMTRSGVIAGTPQYMSPEQARGESIDGRSDLFSLGNVLYAMCTGHSPFRAETTFGVLHRVANAEPRPIREINPEIPGWLCRLIERLHAKRVEDRLASAERVEYLLRQCMAHVEQPDRHPLPALLREPPRARMWRGACLAVVSLAVLVLLAVVAFRPTTRPEPPEPRSVPRNVEPSTAAASLPAGQDDVSSFEAEMQWLDPFQPSAAEVHQTARELNEQTKSFFADGPAAGEFPAAEGTYNLQPSHNPR